VRHHYLSLDPYMRGRMNDAKSYAPPQPLNEVMIGGTAGEVVESRNPSFTPGDLVVGMGGWQEYSVVSGGVRKVETSRIPLQAYLGPVGMPGVTAWYGLNKICEAKAGHTIAVSAASGAGRQRRRPARESERLPSGWFRRRAGQVPLRDRRARLRCVQSITRRTPTASRSMPR
jgi:NADPH-dependent curcumin reductase CurA